jgi:hypothetical protein
LTATIAPPSRAAADDREARPAAGAVDERVAVPAISGIEQLGQTLSARRRVGRHQGGGLAVARARDDLEVALALRRHGVAYDRFDAGERRGLGGKAREETLHGLGGALDLEQHAVLVVEHVADKPLFARQAMDVRTEADALHRALDACTHPRGRGRLARDAGCRGQAVAPRATPPSSGRAARRHS